MERYMPAVGVDAEVEIRHQGDLQRLHGCRRFCSSSMSYLARGDVLGVDAAVGVEGKG
jgi:hypothetical protein